MFITMVDGEDPQTAQTVKQTVVETLEAPRLLCTETQDFVKFKEAREVYERLVNEKSAELGTEIPKTSYRNSIDSSVLELFVTLQWVPESSVDSITENSLKACVNTKATVAADKYDQALVERHLSSVKMDSAVQSLSARLIKLALDYSKMLRRIGYDGFLKERSCLAIQHLLARISHETLRRRACLNFKQDKEKYKKDYKQFLRDLIKDADMIDRSMALTKGSSTTVDDEDSMRDVPSHLRARTRAGSGTPSRKPQAVNKRKAKRKREDDESSGTDKRMKPECLNPKCNKARHFMADCPKSSPEEREQLLDAYY